MEDMRLTNESSDSSDDEASSSDRPEIAEEIQPTVTARDLTNDAVPIMDHVDSQSLSLHTFILPEAPIDSLNFQESLTLTRVDSESSGDESDVESEAESIKTTGTTTRSYISQADRRPPSPYDGIVRLPVDTSPVVKDDFRLLPDTVLTKVGSVRNILENVVVIQAVDPKVFPTLDLHSVLFLNHTTPLGRVFDVFGNVDKPFYSLRFEAEEDIEKFESLAVGTDVFAVPTDPQLTAYVFVNDLFKLKGTDAVGEDNLELPPELQDFSDDEKERQANQEAQRRKRAHHNAVQTRPNGHGPPGMKLPSPHAGGDYQRFRPSLQRGNGFAGPMIRPPQQSPSNQLMNDGNGLVIPPKVQTSNSMLPSPSVHTSTPVNFPTSAPSLVPAQPLNTDPKTLPSAEVLFYNPNTDVTLNANKTRPSLFRNFMR